MTQYNRLNTKLSNSQLNKLKSAIKNENDVVIRLSPNMIGDSNDKTSFPHELLLTGRQVSSTRQAFANNSSFDINFSKTQLSKMIQLGGFLGKLLVPLLKIGLPLIKNVITPLAKSILFPLGLTAAAWAADAGIHKKILGSENTTTLIISNTGVTETVQIEVKEQKGGFISMLLGTLGASLLGNPLTDKGAFYAGKGLNKKGKGIHRGGEGVVRADEGSSNMDF